MNQKSLEALHAFVETGSVAAAAERMLRTPPQVSRLLSSLEEDLGFKIFSREGRRLRLTAEGREFYAEVERFTTAQNDLMLRAEQIRRGRKQHIRLLTAPFISHAVVNQALARVMVRHPQMTAQVDSRVRLDIEFWSRREIFDLGLAPLPIREDLFRVEHFRDVPIVAVMHHSHPLAAQAVVHFDDFARHEIVSTHSRSLLGQTLERLSLAAGIRLNVRVEARNGMIACQMAGLNLGCCIADPFLAMSSGSPDIVIRPFTPDSVLSYAFIHPAAAQRSDIVDEVKAEIIKDMNDALMKVAAGGASLRV